SRQNGAFIGGRGTRAGRAVAIATAIVAAAVVALTVAPPRAAADPIPTALGIPCTPGPGEVQKCSGSIDTRVPSFDGVPLDVNLTFPPAAQDGPHPLIVYLHGWGGSKNAAALDTDGLAQRGYAVMAYSARGFGDSCGAESSRAAPGCARGWIHLADARFEARDTQHLAGLLQDAGLVERGIGVTGDSYGGAQSLILAALKNRVMRPNGRLARWRSPDGAPMRIAAAAPRIGWSDLAYSLVPNGGTLDFRSHNPYRMPAGVAKDSYLTGLFAIGQSGGFYAPPGEDPDANIPEQFDLLKAGEPYDSNPALRRLLSQTKRFHSAYYVEQGVPRSDRRKPAPLLIYNAWTDDLFPADEAIRYAKRVQVQHPGSKLSLFFANGFGHPRATFGETPGIEEARDALFARHLLGDRSADRLPGVQTFTQNCAGEASGPFATRNWRKQHPGEADFSTGETKAFTSAGGDQATARAVDPIFGGGGSCRTVDAADDPGAATYRLPQTTGDGYTLMGSPTVIAKLNTSGEFPQIAARLWDVSPNGSQTLVTRGIYRPTERRGHVFQLHPNGWRFEPGHVPKLELLGQDAPYARPSNGSGFTVEVEQLELELPVRDRPGGGIGKYSPPK
ncbi:MAG: CocE/NonD family hydrolase, partial [Solirubrobacterales bacterium]